jgi:hypothetical protein
MVITAFNMPNSMNAHLLGTKVGRTQMAPDKQPNAAVTEHPSR